MKGVVYSLFDGSGKAVFDWAEAGYLCYCFNYDDADHGDYSAVKIEHDNIVYVNTWIDVNFDPVSAGYEVPDIILSFPPCTDIAVSGSRHFKSKSQKDPLFQIKAVETCKVAYHLAEKYGCPYMIENPVSVLSTLWRKPDHSFHPYEYGGYLDENDVHPDFPEYIKARDAYPKKTCLWIGNGFKMPDKKSVHVDNGFSTQHLKLGGKSSKTKMIRSLTPRGISRAIFLSNSKS